MSDSAIKTAFDASDIFMQDIDERLKYINRQMSIMDYNTDMSVSRDEGYNEGHDDGKREAGRLIATKMLEKNEPIEKIMEYTSLTEQQIQELAQQIK